MGICATSAPTLLNTLNAGKITRYQFAINFQKNHQFVRYAMAHTLQATKAAQSTNNYDKKVNDQHEFNFSSYQHRESDFLKPQQQQGPII